jgi:hypothetical protein
MSRRAKLECAEHHHAAVERMVNSLPSLYFLPPRSGQLFESLDSCKRRLRGFALAGGFDIVRKGGGTKANPSYRFRCIFHGSETRNDRKLEVIVQRDSEGTITSRRQGCHKRTTTAVYVVSALFLQEYRQTRLRGQVVYPYYAKQRSSRPPARR